MRALIRSPRAKLAYALVAGLLAASQAFASDPYNFRGAWDDRSVGSLTAKGFDFDGLRSDGVRMVGKFELDGEKLKADVSEYFNGELADHYVSELTR